MKLGIFLKFVMLFAVMAIVLGTIAVLSYKNYRHQHYEGVASAQLATAVVGLPGCSIRRYRQVIKRRDDDLRGRMCL